MFAFFVWGLLRLVRWKFDRSAEARSREARDQRRSARRTQTIALIVGSVAVIAVLWMVSRYFGGEREQEFAAQPRVQVPA